MQQHIRFLVVEDEKPWSQALSAKIREYFEEKARFRSSDIRSASAYDGDQGYQHLSQSAFDLVTLDMNLGEGVSRSKISGLDLLGEIAGANRSYFVIIITGTVTDQSLDQLYGKEAAALMRYGVMNEAIRRLGGVERVRILHKPDRKNVEESMEELAAELFSALDQYCALSRERNIFRPFPGHSSLWEVRYNGSYRLTIPSIEPFEIIRSVLAKPNQEMNTVRLMQACAHSSGTEAVTPPAETMPRITSSGPDDDDGLDWTDADATSTHYNSPVAIDESTITLEACHERNERSPIRAI